MTAKNNFAELSGAGHSCDLMYTWDGTLLTYSSPVNDSG